MTPDDAESGPSQNIARASRILQALAEAGTAGARLTDVARATGLSKPVVHRALGGLVTYGLASQDGDTRYFLGDRVFAWASLANGRFEIAARIRPHLVAVADDLGDTVYFSIRRGDESVCFGRVEGSYPIKAITLEVGDRRPLGVGSGSLAILASQDDDEIDRILREGAADRARFPLTPDDLTAGIARTRETGVAEVDGSQVQGIPGMSSIGLPVRDARGRVRAAISVAGVVSRMGEPRRSEIIARLTVEVANVERNLAGVIESL